MKLIVETLMDEAELIVEKSTDSKTMHISGIYMQAALKNKNGRMYDADGLDEEVQRYVGSYVKEGRALGELCHPPTPTVNPDRACHRIVELHRDGNNFVGKSRLLDPEAFPTARTVRGLIDEGVKIGVSSRGMGSLKEADGVMMVQKDFKLVTVDVVLDPSAPDAFVQGVMENVDWVYDEKSNGWRAVALAENTKKAVRRMTRQQVEENSLRLFEEFVAELRSRRI